mmetsp:Transcript_837/g.1195  ORF Transcript_837/g.1195 Transcript_837/m.1195 type:complete len:103 (+) Transcript_837:413-721(+)
MSAHSSVKGRLPMPAFDASHHVCHYAAQGMGLRKRLWPVAARYTGPENSGYFHRLHFGQKNLPGLSQSILVSPIQRGWSHFLQASHCTMNDPSQGLRQKQCS